MQPHQPELRPPRDAEVERLSVTDGVVSWLVTGLDGFGQLPTELLGISAGRSVFLLDKVSAHSTGFCNPYDGI